MIVVCRQKNIHVLCYNVCCFPRLWRWLRLLVYFDLGPFFYALEWPLHWWQWYIRHHPWPIRAHFLQDYKCNFTKNCSLVLPVAGGNIWVTTASGTVTVLDCSTVVTCVSSSVFSGWRPDKSKTYTLNLKILNLILLADDYKYISSITRYNFSSFNLTIS